MQNVHKILQNVDLIKKLFSLENYIFDVEKMKSAIKKEMKLRKQIFT